MLCEYFEKSTEGEGKGRTERDLRLHLTLVIAESVFP